jgi:DNA replication protein DnaC
MPVTVCLPRTPPKRPASINAARGHLAVLKLHDAAEALPAVLDQAAAQDLSMTAALDRLLSIEVEATEARRLAGRLRFACLPTPASFKDFDYDAAAGVDRKVIEELATCRYLETATNVLLIGPPGVGKPHLSVGLARRQHMRVSHLFHHRRRPRRPVPSGRDRRQAGHHDAVLRRPHIARDRRTGYLPLPGEAAAALFQVVSQGYEDIHRHDHQPRRRILGRSPRRQHLAAAMLDRLLHRSIVFNLDGDSYRLCDQNARAETPPNDHRNTSTTTVTVAHKWGFSESTAGELR